MNLVPETDPGPVPDEETEAPARWMVSPVVNLNLVGQPAGRVLNFGGRNAAVLMNADNSVVQLVLAALNGFEVFRETSGIIRTLCTRPGRMSLHELARQILERLDENDAILQLVLESAPAEFSLPPAKPALWHPGMPS